MIKRHEDRRINRTRKALREALMALVIRKGFEAITIEDITEQAEMGRATFYLHYRGKEDLLLDCLKYLMDDVKQLIAVTLTDGIRTGDSDSPRERVRLISFAFKYAGENLSLYQVLYKGEGAVIAQPLLRDIVHDAAIQLFSPHIPALQPDGSVNPYLELTAVYFSGSIMGLMTWWLENGMPYPPEEMAEFYRANFFTGLASILPVPAELRDML